MGKKEKHVVGGGRVGLEKREIKTSANFASPDGDVGDKFPHGSFQTQRWFSGQSSGKRSGQGAEQAYQRTMPRVLITSRRMEWLLQTP